jgi:hypothetical protein
MVNNYQHCSLSCKQCFAVYNRISKEKTELPDPYSQKRNSKAQNYYTVNQDITLTLR